MNNTKKLDTIHYNYINGNNKYNIELVNDYIEYDFFNDYINYLKELYVSEKQAYIYFTDFTIKYMRIKNR